MTGNYGLDGRTFDFHGTARLEATVSQMMTGWKSILLKPVDPFFRKNGAGTEVPISVTGTQSAPHFALDFKHKNGSRTDDSNKNKNKDEDNKDDHPFVGRNAASRTNPN
jgi:hypothetical protein